MTWDVDRDHYIFYGLTRFPHMLGGKHYTATKPPCGFFSKCVVIGSGILPRNSKMPLIEVYSRNYSSLPRCVCVLGQFFQVVSLLLMCNVARISACLVVSSYWCV